MSTKENVTPVVDKADLRDLLTAVTMVAMNQPGTFDGEGVQRAFGALQDAVNGRKPREQRLAETQATITRAAQYLTGVPHETALAVLAQTTLHEHVRLNPDKLAADLAASSPEDPTGRRFGDWKAAQQVCRAAGLPY
jgi:hypothetical protein